MRRARLALLAIGCFLLGAGPCVLVVSNPSDPLLDLEWFNVQGILEVGPGVPLILAGPDGKLGSPDDVIDPDRPGDVDLVVRSGAVALGASFPPPHDASTAPTIVAGPFGTGTSLDFVVSPSSHAIPPALGAPVSSPALVGVPVLVTAFADLDGDGWIGITERDQDPLDASLEEEELQPVGQTLVISGGGATAGRLHVSAGGPPGARLRLVLAAGAWVGTLDPAFFGGVIPAGPLLTTRLPFLPVSDPAQVLEGGPAGPEPPTADGPVGVEVQPAFDPVPGHPVLGEAFTLATDGSEQSVDLADAASGPMVRFGLARRPDPLAYRGLASRPLRPGLNGAGQRVLLEVLQRLPLADDGPSGLTVAHVVALDGLGNLAAPPAPASVEVSAEGPVSILYPDADGDTKRETLAISDSGGVGIILNDLGGSLDDANRGTLQVRSPSGVLSRTPVFLADPDVDDSGLVDALDRALVQAADGSRDGDVDFDPDLDLDGDGRVDEADVARVDAALGASVPAP